MKRCVIAGLMGVLGLAGCNSNGGGTRSANEATDNIAGPVEPSASTAAADHRGLYPGSRPGESADQFVTSDPVDRVVAWYKDPARRDAMLFMSTEKEDYGYLVVGTAGNELKAFALKLKPRSDGGTDIQVLPYDPNTGLKQ